MSSFLSLTGLRGLLSGQPEYAEASATEFAEAGPEGQQQQEEESPAPAPPAKEDEKKRAKKRQQRQEQQQEEERAVETPTEVPVVPSVPSAAELHDKGSGSDGAEGATIAAEPVISPSPRLSAGSSPRVSPRPTSPQIELEISPVVVASPPLPSSPQPPPQSPPPPSSTADVHPAKTGRPLMQPVIPYGPFSEKDSSKMEQAGGAKETRLDTIPEETKMEVKQQQDGPEGHQQAAAAEPEKPAEKKEEKLVKFDTYQWRCVRAECRKITSPYDGSTVICPVCGPYSMVRYCSKACQYADNTQHFLYQCGKLTLKMKADKYTIVQRQTNFPRPIPTLTGYNRTERHRQVVRNCLDQTADYFIFDDAIQWIEDGYPGNWTPEQHGCGKMIKTVSFTAGGSFVPDKRVFKRLLRMCLFISPQRQDMSRWLFKFVRHRLTELGELTNDILQSLIWQVMKEFELAALPSQMMADEGPEDWPHMVRELEILESEYETFLTGTGGLGIEWTNAV